MTDHEERSECPLCMEILDEDELSFYPCSCGYQVCRFCWHRIKSDENGLCPACRKAYPDDPAVFLPVRLTQGLTSTTHKAKKSGKKQNNSLQRRRQTAETRKQFANFRVVQRNLVYVVGLPARLADVEVLSRFEYFGKYGKIAKIVISKSTPSSKSQRPSVCAHVTFSRAEDAIKSIHFVHNTRIDGKTLKCTLGTTKYCSQFLQGSVCTKTDCLFLHEPGEAAASFTKEDMQQGKHTLYVRTLLEAFANNIVVTDTLPNIKSTDANIVVADSMPDIKRAGSRIRGDSC